MNTQKTTLTGVSAHPLVTVGIPTRNRGSFLLPIALKSILGQSYRNLEIIISDNASTDITGNLCLEYAKQDSRIRYVRQERLIPGIDNLAFVLKQATGEYFMWACDDDWWDETFIEKTLAALELNSNYAVAMSFFREKYHLETLPFESWDFISFTHNCTMLSHLDLLKKYLTRQMRPIFFFGLYRTDFAKEFFARKIPLQYNGLRMLLSEMALSTKLYSVPEFLHVRFQDPRPHYERHHDSPLVKAETRIFAKSISVFYFLYWLWSSKIVSLRNKYLAFFPWLVFLWGQRGVFYWDMVRAVLVLRAYLKRKVRGMYQKTAGNS